MSLVIHVFDFILTKIIDYLIILCLGYYESIVLKVDRSLAESKFDAHSQLVKLVYFRSYLNVII